jgi:hypothetical protein
MDSRRAALRVPTARQLYGGICRANGTDQESLERSFFTSIRLKNGTYKTTHSGRLDDLNDLVNRYLPRGRRLDVMDVGVSSGITTMEWMSSLERLGIEHHVTAGDLTLRAWLVSLGRHLHVLVDADQYPLQYDVFGRAVSSPPWGRQRAIYALPVTLLNFVLATRYAVHGSGMVGIRRRPLTLVSPRLIERKNVEFVEDDITRSTVWPRRFAAVRAANILNRGYFDETTLAGIVRRLRSRLVNGGLLIVCRTDEANRNRATVFSLDQHRRFRIVTRLNDGAELESLVLSLGAEST